MLCACLFSVNKRAKNYRDATRRYRKDSTYYYIATEKKKEYYFIKKQLLAILNPTCIHREDCSPSRIRIYDYDGDEYWSHLKKGDFIWENSYYDHDLDYEVSFGDIEDPSKHKYRYYLFYDLGKHTFHTPISEENLKDYPDLKILDIEELETYGKDTEELISMQFVRKVLDRLYCGGFKFSYKENISTSGHLPKPPEDWEPLEFIKEDRVFVKPDHAISTVLNRKYTEVPVDQYIYQRAMLHLPKKTAVKIAHENGMKTNSRTRRCDAVQYLYDNNLLAQYADMPGSGIGVTKYEYLRAGIPLWKVRSLRKSGKLTVIGTYAVYSPKRKDYLYSVSQYIKYRNTGEL